MHISGINYESCNDGEGMRTVIFVSGCSHNCKGCHNPQTHDPHYGTELTDEMLQEIFLEIHKREAFLQGITISGGDPLYKDNLITVCGLLISFRTLFPKMDIWLYTGYSWKDIVSNRIFQSVAEFVDVMVTEPFILEQRDIVSKPFRGSRNQRLILARKTMLTSTLVSKPFYHELD